MRRTRAGLHECAGEVGESVRENIMGLRAGGGCSRCDSECAGRAERRSWHVSAPAVTAVSVYAYTKISAHAEQ